MWACLLSMMIFDKWHFSINFMGLIAFIILLIKVFFFPFIVLAFFVKLAIDLATGKHLWR
jgi:hypothetical protein